MKMSIAWKRAKEFVDTHPWKRDWKGRLKEGDVDRELKKRKFTDGEFLVNDYRPGVLGPYLLGMDNHLGLYSKKRIPSIDKVYDKIKSFAKKNFLRIREHKYGYGSLGSISLEGSSGIAEIGHWYFYASNPELFEKIGKEIYGLKANPILPILDEANRLGVDLEKYRLHTELRRNIIDVYFIPHPDPYSDENLEAVIISHDTSSGVISYVKGSYNPKRLSQMRLLKEFKGFIKAEKNAVFKMGSPEDYRKSLFNEGTIDKPIDQTMNAEPIENKLPELEEEDYQPELFEI